MTTDEVLYLLDSVLCDKRFNDIQEMVFRHAWEGLSYAEIAEKLGYDAEYIKQVGWQVWQLLSEALDLKVSKSNFHTVLRRYAFNQSTQLTSVVGNKPLERSRDTKIDEVEGRNPPAQTSIVLSTYQDWGEAFDVQSFYGREEELTQMSQWIEGDRCRIVAILGMGGIGKTALAVKLAERVQKVFDYAIWLNLRDAPPIAQKLNQLISFLSHQQQTDIPESLEEQISCLMEYLRKSRCMLVFDNFESVLRGTTANELARHVGQYREGYEAYGLLVRRIGESQHQSCLILTSREEPRQIARMKGSKVQTLFLKGLAILEAKAIFQEQDEFQGSDEEWQQLITHYAGNPLALKIIAPLIQNFLNRSISHITSMLSQDLLVFDDLRDLLDRQFERLSEPERQVMYWLAINRESTTVSDLQADLFPPKEMQEIVGILDSLRRRSLIEKMFAKTIEAGFTGFTQQPVIMEYMTDRLIERMRNEIVNGLELNHFISSSIDCYALIKATAKDYIRESQIRLILEPFIRSTISRLGTKQAAIDRLNEILLQLRSQAVIPSGYAIGNILNLAIHLEVDLTGYDFSHFTIRQAFLKETNLHNCNAAYADFQQCIFSETFGSVISVAFSPDEKLLATGDSNGEIQVWQISDGKQIFTYKGHSTWVWFVAFSPSSQILASCGVDRIIMLRDMHTRECLKVLRGHSSMNYCVDFNSNGTILASSAEDSTIRLWDVTTGELLVTLVGHASPVWTIAFSPDGKIIASGEAARTIKLWDCKTGECLQTWEAHSGWVKSLSFSPDSKVLFSGSFDCTVKQWDVRTGECIRTLYGHSHPVVSTNISPAGNILASSSYDCTIRLWDVNTGQCLRTLKGHTNRVWSVAFSPDGKILASGGDDHTTKLWDVATGQCARTIQGCSYAMYKATIHPKDWLVAGGCEDETIKLWDLNTGQHRTLRGHTYRVFCVAFSPDGEILASGSGDRTVKLWDWRSGKCLRTLNVVDLAGYGSWIHSVSFSPDGQTLISGSYDNSVKLWDIQTGECIRVFLGHTNYVLSTAFSPDGQFLISGGYGKTGKLWRISTGECLRTWQAHDNCVWSVDFSPDAQTVVTGGDDRTVKIWNVANGECLMTLEGHEDQVLSTTFSHDGKMLVSAAADKTIKLWDIETGNCIRTLCGHKHLVYSSIFCPDLETLISSSFDETVKIWNVGTGECIRTLQVPRPYEGLNITGIRGLNEAQISTLKSLGAFEEDVRTI